MKLDIISESQQPLHPRCGFAFAGLACELPLAILELLRRCPRCMGELKHEVFTTVEGEDIPEAEYCDNCGYRKDYSEEGKCP